MTIIKKRNGRCKEDPNGTFMVKNIQYEKNWMGLKALNTTEKKQNLKT